MIQYTTPVSVDHAGVLPGRVAGYRFEESYKGRLFQAEVVGPAVRMPNGSVLRDVHYQQVEGPLVRGAIQ